MNHELKKIMLLEIAKTHRFYISQEILWIEETKENCSNRPKWSKLFESKLRWELRSSLCKICVSHQSVKITGILLKFGWSSYEGNVKKAQKSYKYVIDLIFGQSHHHFSVPFERIRQKYKIFSGPHFMVCQNYIFKIYEFFPEFRSELRSSLCKKMCV